ncbi:tyrosine-protein phosphatase [Nocardia carnea]|uniref:tyrosine-protein phosphatase n=1 Tax=Nocardia carnea TaxID=37328 RepID=UPI0024587E7C|nr:tyrosine-protein phosphatase [Nocardia carnea]
MPNLRDLGGLPAGDRKTRSHLLYRSAVPLPGDPAPAGFPNWPPRTVIDLRSPSEQWETAHPLASEHTVLRRIPLMTDAQVARPSAGREIVEVYLEILAGAGPQLAEIVAVAAEAPGPILLHCAAGKDRTGIAIALLLRSAGVPAGEVVTDYLATNDHLADVLYRLGKSTAPTGETHPADRDRRGAVREAIESVLEHWDSSGNGVRGWLRAHGLPEQVIDAWNARITTAGND